MAEFNNIFNCQKCNKTLWFKYHKLPDGKTLCPICYAEYKKQLMEKTSLKEKDEEEQLKQYIKVVAQNTTTKEKKDSGEVKQPKKKNTNLIIGIVAVICIVALILFFVSFVFHITLFPNLFPKEIEVVSHNIKTITSYNYYCFGEAKVVTGTIKNVADRNIDTVYVTVNFYDSDNELLHRETTTVSYLAKGETDTFEVTYCYNEPYYAQYDHYTVSVST